MTGLSRNGFPYHKAALTAAVCWTIAIFFACLWPGEELPHSDIPFIDKWTHFVLFGVFSALWLCAYPPPAARLRGRLLLMALIATALGGLIEGLQSALPRLGRSGDVIDAVADALGGVLGSLGFLVLRGPISRMTGQQNADFHDLHDGS